MPLTARLVHRVNDNLRLQIILAVVIAAALGVFIKLTALGVNAYWPTPAALIHAGLFLLAMLLLIMERRFDALMLLAAAVCLCCGMYARVTMLSFQSSDYINCLLPWTKKLGSLPLREALSTPIGDYNLPYLYFLTILSRTSWDELLHIKSMSCFFDVVLAYLVMRITALEVKDRRLQLASFLIILISPTVMINSAQWAQCDSTYVAFCLLAILGAMTGRGRLCAIAWTIAFCFKLQAIFILPALVCGRSLLSCMNIYGGQLGEYNKLFLNAPTVWRFFGASRPAEYNNMAVFVALGAIVIFTMLCLSFSKKLSRAQLFRLFFISSMLVPYLLPRMHERYFYMAEMLALIYFMYDRRKWYVPVALTLTSLAGSIAAMCDDIVFDQLYAAMAYLVILAVETRALFKELWHVTPDTIPVE